MRNMNFRSNDISEISLLKDSQWSVIDGEPCRVVNFTSKDSIENSDVSIYGKFKPYASVTLECKKFPGLITGFITNKTDFINLRQALGERILKQDEEVLIFWSKKHYKNIFYKICSMFMPKLWVMICQKGAFDLLTDKNLKPELKGEERWKATAPIKERKPEVMK